MLSDTPHTQWCLRMLVNLRALTSVHHGFAALPRRMAQSLAEHRAIRDAVRRGEFTRAAEFIKQHEQAAFDALSREFDPDRHAVAEETV
jgi:DNA-binding GntR family transcriptional regulator